MRSVLWWIGVTVGALALAALIAHGFNVRLTGLPGAIVDTYDFMAQAVFGKLEPWLARRLAGLRDLSGRDLHLYPHWKNVFLLMWIFFLADIRSAVEQRRPLLAIVLSVWGTVVALGAGIGAGTVVLDGGATTASDIVLLAFPALGVTLHQAGWCLLEAIVSRSAGESALARFSLFVRDEVLPIALGGLLSILLAAYARSVPLLAQSSEPGLALLVAMIATLAFFHTWRGGVYAALDRLPDERWSHAVSRTGSARLAFFMLSAITGAALIFALDAALKAAGA
jgi:hypothetical protein